MVQRRSPGAVRDAIIEHFQRTKAEANVDELHAVVSQKLGGDVARSSVRSYLNLNTPKRFERTGRGRYRFKG